MAEGREYRSNRLKSILETRDTLVVLDYSGPGGIAGMAFTPFIEEFSLTGARFEIETAGNGVLIRIVK